jgi:hypothetical protein
MAALETSAKIFSGFSELPSTDPLQTVIRGER